ncbi:MATE family efflux transporter [Humibacter ginsenosidimutans]|uniref:MATE family efflux transporter n=1 Tax=Humibacter ginsenosidimutans TaxID=2599293 RepID=A0A5B8M831_9MICO|nr:MATE family efflux transporter [Humibacter ginsenosidimutans]QDZ15590.1 MATE family efflux transporter [Humibacter ginsenosidimutans]
MLRRAADREILRLAVPAFGALVAEPLFLLADSAMVGHLGATPLAALGIAGAVLQTIVGLMVFLAYGTTPAVARRLGAGHERDAVEAGIDGMWLAVGIGVVLAVVGAIVASPLVALFGASRDVTGQASAYLAVSMAGLPAMLIVYAAAGLLRGLQDTRTPLWVASGGFAANIALNAVFIYGAGLGVVGSAVGTVIAQWGMAAVYIVVAVRHGRRVGAELRPRWAGVRGLSGSGWWLFLRTASLRVAIILAVALATDISSDALAAWQVTMAVYNAVALALDALAIAAQALIGRSLGIGDLDAVRAVLRRCLLWGVGGGAVLGVVLIALSPIFGHVFTGDQNVLALLPVPLAIIGATTPLGGYVFVLDGVLIGAGDARYLAATGLANLAVFVPLAWLAVAYGGSAAASLSWLTLAFALGYLGARAVTLGLRARGSRWMVVGAVRA